MNRRGFDKVEEKKNKVVSSNVSCSEPWVSCQPHGWVLLQEQLQVCSSAMMGIQGGLGAVPSSQFPLHSSNPGPSHLQGLSRVLPTPAKPVGMLFQPKFGAESCPHSAVPLAGSEELGRGTPYICHSR